MSDLTVTPSINDALIAAGIPVDWIRNVDGTSANFQIFYLPQATDEQKAQAQQIVTAIIDG